METGRGTKEQREREDEAQKERFIPSYKHLIDLSFHPHKNLLICPHISARLSSHHYISADLRNTFPSISIHTPSAVYLPSYPSPHTPIYLPIPSYT